MQKRKRSCTETKQSSTSVSDDLGVQTAVVVLHDKFEAFGFGWLRLVK